MLFKIAHSKNAFPNCHHKDTFISPLRENAVKDKIGISKSLIMHD